MLPTHTFWGATDRGHGQPRLSVSWASSTEPRLALTLRVSSLTLALLWPPSIFLPSPAHPPALQAHTCSLILDSFRLRDQRLPLLLVGIWSHHLPLRCLHTYLSEARGTWWRGDWGGAGCEGPTPRRQISKAALAQPLCGLPPSFLRPSPFPLLPSYLLFFRPSLPSFLPLLNSVTEM